MRRREEKRGDISGDIDEEREEKRGDIRGDIDEERREERRFSIISLNFIEFQRSSPNFSKVSHSCPGRTHGQ